MLKVNTETISNEIAAFIGPNWRDYRPVSEIVSEFVRTFGHFHVDDVPERVWVPFINSMERRDTSRNYPASYPVHGPSIVAAGHIQVNGEHIYWTTEDGYPSLDW